MLVDGEIEPGQRIRVDAISRQLGSSQTPGHESLLRLEAELNSPAADCTNLSYPRDAW